MTRSDGYSLSSILVHWLAAILVVSLFFTHEGERGSAAYIFHVSGGAIAGLFLLWRVWHRMRRGMPDAPDQWAVFNLAAWLVHRALLVAIVVSWAPDIAPFVGQELDVFGPEFLPWERTGWAEIVEQSTTVRPISSSVVALHLIGAVKHVVFDRRGAGLRMFKPASGGR